MNRAPEHDAKHELEYVKPFSPHTGAYCKMHADAHVNGVPNFSSSTRHAPGTTAYARPSDPKMPLSNAQFAQHAFAYVPPSRHAGSNATFTHRSRQMSSEAVVASNSVFVAGTDIGGKRVVPGGSRAPSVLVTNRLLFSNVMMLRNLNSEDMARF